MLARLLLVLLLAAFTAPSATAAACHDAPRARHAMPMPDAAPDEHALPVHACPGCIPPSLWARPRLGAPLFARAAEPMAAAPDQLIGASPPPDLPPPRGG